MPTSQVRDLSANVNIKVHRIPRHRIPAEFNQEAFQEIKQEYGPGPVIQSEPIQIIYAILTKSVQ